MGNFYSVLENDFTKNVKCGQATYLQMLCRDSCMLNAWLQRARLIFRFCQSCPTSHDVYREKFYAPGLLCPTVGDIYSYIYHAHYR